MSALTSQMKCDTLETVPSSDATHFQEELPPELIFLDYSDGTFSVQNTFMDSYLDPTNLFYPDIYRYLLPTSTFPCESFMPPSDISPMENADFPCLKRQRSIGIDASIEFVPEFKPPFIRGCDMDCCQVLPHPLPEFPECKTSEGIFFEANIVNCEKKIEARSISGSAQSMAARERRRKIKEKTQELGRLIPGGLKLNTAEMLNAASKYVKYLQTQVGMLELMHTMKDSEGSAPREDMEILLASNIMQEKLYSKEKCIVPRELVDFLAKHHDVQSKASIREMLNQLMRLDGCG